MRNSYRPVPLDRLRDPQSRRAHLKDTRGQRHFTAFIKSQQDQRPPPRLKTNSERIGYRKTGRMSPGRKSFVDRMVERRRAEQLAAASE